MFCFCVLHTCCSREYSREVKRYVFRFQHNRVCLWKLVNFKGSLPIEKGHNNKKLRPPTVTNKLFGIMFHMLFGHLVNLLIQSFFITWLSAVNVRTFRPPSAKGFERTDLFILSGLFLQINLKRILSSWEQVDLGTSKHEKSLLLCLTELCHIWTDLWQTNN